MDYYESLRKLFKRRRSELKMRQTEVAEKADISNNFYSNIERGQTKPSVDTVIKICKALNLSLDEIIFEKEIPKYELSLKETMRELDSIIKDEKKIETVIEFCNAITILARKLKNEE